MAENDPTGSIAEENRKELSAPVKNLGDRSMSVLDLIAAWSNQVTRIRSELYKHLSDACTWGGEDLIGALYMRDFVEESLVGLPESARGAAEAAVAFADARFLAFTEDDLSGDVLDFADENEIHRGWWWHRVPVRGPVREDLLGRE